MDFKRCVRHCFSLRLIIDEISFPTNYNYHILLYYHIEQNQDWLDSLDAISLIGMLIVLKGNFRVVLMFDLFVMIDLLTDKVMVLDVVNLAFNILGHYDIQINLLYKVYVFYIKVRVQVKVFVENIAILT